LCSFIDINVSTYIFMKLFSLNAETWFMDGGACFGVVPKTIWSRHVEADANNLIPLASRSLLADTGERLILVDTGIGNKQSDKFFSYYHITGDRGFKSSLRALGYTPEQVTDVILTHLHFDHVGGALEWGNDGKTAVPVFPNATYHCTREQYDWAMNPNPRERASYFRENFVPLYDNGQLSFIHEEGLFCEGVSLEIRHGHTRGQLIPCFEYNGRKVYFMADFIAAVLNIPLPYVPAFDIDPLLSMKEKEIFLNRMLLEDHVLFFQHDHDNECCTVGQTPKGIRAKEIFTLSGI
jgi:glyoxylase-like metal-dependent hydrolase (beta-lactamase superfamily II)